MSDLQDPPPPDFGPGGYLPPRAARRARKIVLRAPMGLGWPIAAAVAGVVVLGVGLVAVRSLTGPPGPPLAAVAAIADVAEATAVVTAEGVLVLRAAGTVRAFRAPADPVAWCQESRRLEAAVAVWTAEGALVGGGGASLQPLPSVVHNGILYADPGGSAGSPRPPDPRGEVPQCS